MSNINIESHEYKKQFMHEATRLAIDSVEKGWGGPFGAVIVKNGKVIGRGQNRVLLTGIPVYHAEVTAIIDASLRLNAANAFLPENWKRTARPTGRALSH